MLKAAPAIAALTLLTALALFLFGGQVLNGFAFALVCGIVVGTYSSVFVASPILIFWQDLMDKRKRGGKVSGTKGRLAPNVVAGKQTAKLAK